MKIPFSKKSLSFDMITLSSHKIGGPKGVGALVIDNKIIKSKGLSPMVLGGGQEAGLRSGTENVPGIAAFSIAIEEKMKTLNEDYEKTNALREYLIKRLSSDTTLAKISPTLPNLHAPHIINLTLPSVKSEVMLHYLSSLGIYVSSGSACSSNSAHISSALISYGRTEKEADASIRVSLCPENTKEDIDALCEGLISGINKLAKMR
jgi:cysteine desulfurase